MLQTVFRYTAGTFIKLIAAVVAYPFSKEKRHALSAAYQALEYPFYGHCYVDLSEVLRQNNLEITLAPLKANEHNTTAFELTAVCALVKDREAGVIFEIGTYDGRTTRAMAMNTPSEGKLYTLNLPPAADNAVLNTDVIDIQLASKVVSGERFQNTPEAQKITQLWGDSATFDFSPYYNRMDLVFIDGAHSTAYVQNDTKAALSMIKSSGGYIIWHDAHLFGVKKYMEQLVFNESCPVYFIKGTTLAVAAVKGNRFVDLISE